MHKGREGADFPSNKTLIFCRDRLFPRSKKSKKKSVGGTDWGHNYYCTRCWDGPILSDSKKQITWSDVGLITRCWMAINISLEEWYWYKQNRKSSPPKVTLIYTRMTKKRNHSIWLFSLNIATIPSVAFPWWLLWLALRCPRVGRIVHWPSEPTPLSV